MAVVLRRLGSETFGHKLHRARRESGVNLRDVAELLSAEVGSVSFATVGRLGTLRETPTDPKRRQLACLVVLATGFEPEEFGLTQAELPGSVDVDRFLAKAEEMRRAASLRGEGTPS